MIMTFSKTNPYELDVIGLYTNIHQHIETLAYTAARKNRYLFKIRSDIRHYCRLNSINYNIYFKQRKKLVIPSRHFLYFRFLPLALAHLPLEQLRDFLDYQRRHFDGNILAMRDEFKAYVKENLATEVRELSFSDTDLRLATIMSWVES